MDTSKVQELLHKWEFFARPNQLAPEEDFLTWLLLAGRGFGKTRTGAEWVRKRVETQGARRIALVARTPADIRDVMIEGESGILTISNPDFMPSYEPSKRHRLTWPNGAIANGYSSYEPDALRGPQFDTAWGDELASWKYPRETWENLQFGLRLGVKPQVVVTTTPKPVKLVGEILEADSTVVTRGSTYDNIAHLAPAFFKTIIAKYAGTRIGQQEIFAQLLEEAEGALWSRDSLDEHRVPEVPKHVTLTRIIVALDPAVTSSASSDETGIIVAGLGNDQQGYVLHDGSERLTPNGWAQRSIGLYERFGANLIVAEVNNGGDLVETNLRIVDRDKIVPYRGVHAAVGKQARAEPVALLYEQGRIHHVGMFPELEDQLCNWEPLSGDKSPDRLDALVWALSEFMVQNQGLGVFV